MRNCGLLCPKSDSEQVKVLSSRCFLMVSCPSTTTTTVVSSRFTTFSARGMAKWADTRVQGRNGDCRSFSHPHPNNRNKML